MKTSPLSASLNLLAVLLSFAITGELHAQSTTFTYQGRLEENGTPFTGSAEFQPTLWDALGGGAPVAVNAPARVIVTVSDGLFALPLDFGANFPGAGRWLQLEVRTALGSFTLLTPRQRLTPAPYAITAGSLSGALPATQLSGTYPGALIFDNAANAFSGSGAGLTGLNASQLTGGTVPTAALGNAWRIGGNAGTTPGAHFLGTTDNQSLEIKVYGERVLRLEFEPVAPSIGSPSPNFISGHAGNEVTPGIVGATIAGGGGTNWWGATAPQRVSGHFATIGGGVGSEVQGDVGTIAGGERGLIAAPAFNSFIGGGAWNSIYGPDAMIGGGRLNNIQTNATGGVVGGGINNSLEQGATGAVVVGGNLNRIRPDAAYATIGGGGQNTIQTNAIYGTIPGGTQNSATNYAFAAGRRAKANHTGAFVWADSQSADAVSQRDNQFRVRADGGAYLDLNEGHFVDFRRWNSLTAPSRLIHTSTGAYLSEGGAWVNSSDRARKENLAPVDPRAVLDAVTRLPVATWNYQAESDENRHLGPMAQDFHAAFGLGGDDRAIATVDADGVALAAIQGLNQKLNEELKQKETEIAKLHQRLEALEKIVLNGKPE